MEQETTESGMADKKDLPVVATTGSETAEMTDARRDELATKLVDRFSLWSGAAGLIPIPLADTAAVGALQFQMLRRLSDIYGVPFSENFGKSIIASLAGVAIPASTASSAGSALKSLPAVGTAIGALTMSAVSASATYLIGRMFVQHFASGGTLLDFNPPDFESHAKKLKAVAKSNADKLWTDAKSGADKLLAGAKSGADKLFSGAKTDAENSSRVPRS